MKEILLAERTDTYKHGFLVARMSDLMRSRLDYVKTKGSVLDRGIKFVNRMLEGYGFIFEKGSSDYAHDNVRLYRLSTRMSGGRGKPSIELKKYLEDVRDSLEKIKSDPDSAGQDMKQAGFFFSQLSEILYSDLQSVRK